ncbi:hypothetical protein GOP47_0014431 [Adiantum capillus-veneris]|uniref:t-SNARE coiled-coil homology domain-containing protein n=1 Tax=Adiantum capillus-veneris TaxID=13818 RepID=A0A9D4ZC50_ADICA|nr:hypothetical protein GOP47_0014431 [Adiantum capillus-veneris]
MSRPSSACDCGEDSDHKETPKDHFGRHQNEGLDFDIEAGVCDDDSGDKHGGLLEFYPKVHAIQMDLDKIQDLLSQLQEENEVSKTLSQPAAVKEMKKTMEAHVDEVIKITRIVKEKLEKLDKENIVNRKKTGCEEGTSVDRSRVSLTLSLKRKLQNLLKDFQIFLDMAVLVEAQGEMLDNIEDQVSKAAEHTERGVQLIKKAKSLQKNKRKWMLIAMILLLIIIVVILVPVMQPWKERKA